MQRPTIHNNGTSREELTRLYTDAGGALYVAFKALSEAAPNGRDYYPQGAVAFEAARREHEARQQAIKTVIDDMTRLAEYCLGFDEEG